MSRKVRFLRFSARLICALLVGSMLLGGTVPVQASQQPGIPVNLMGQGLVSPAATVNVATSFVWAGPGIQFWWITTLHRGDIVPVNGMTAGGAWFQVTTTVGKGWVPAKDVTISGNIPVVDPGPIGVVITGRASVRANPGINASAVSVLGRNQQVLILGQNADGSWLKVRYRFGFGWVRSNLISVMGSPSTTVGAPVAVVNAGSLNVRTGPSLLFQSLGTVPGGTSLPIIGRSRDGFWLQVQSTFGTGWVEIDHVIPMNYFGSAPITDK